MLPKKILFCTDFSKNSEPARQLAIDYAKAFGAQLIIVHVVDTTGFPTYGDWVGEDWTGLVADEIKNILVRFKESADASLESVAKECSLVLNDVKTYCKLGAPQKEIIDLAVEESVGLIVMGTHGRTAVKHLLMGSIARSVLRMAHRPVLIVEALSGKVES
ncbi:MAG: universal stress protein [Desulfomonile sp.]|jgi:universal stress protein A